MSEYQYYEFLTIDRPLTAGEVAELRALSTRATITPFSFSNEYNWGNFKADPDDARELLNYRKAFDFVSGCLASGDPITEGLIREIHTAPLFTGLSKA